MANEIFVTTLKQGAAAWNEFRQRQTWGTDAHIDFDGADLEGISLNDAHLRGCDFSGANDLASGTQPHEGRPTRRPRLTCVRKAKIEKATLKVVRQSLLCEDTIQAILEELAALEKAEPKTSDQNIAEFGRQIREADREIRNLTTAIKAGGPIDQLVDELKATTEHKRALERTKDQATRVETEIENVDLKAVTEALKGALGS